MNILHVSAECSPFVKVGGLADVVGTLPQEIKRLRNMETRVIIPYYQSVINRFGSETTHVTHFSITLGTKRSVYVGIESLKRGNILYYFVDNIFYFGSRSDYYNYGDESERFAFFQIAVLEAICRIDFKPDIIHVHDWHTAVIPLLIKRRYHDIHAKTVLSIHNLQYQGIFPLEDAQLFQLEDQSLSHEGNLNFLRAGIETSDLIVTVSRTYAAEIMTDYYGYGMQRLLREHSDKVIGILNGISTRAYNPETDRLLAERYSVRDFRSGKKKNRDALEKRLKTSYASDLPLIGIVSRLVSQKGFDLIRRVFDEMLEQSEFNLVVLGDGESEYVDYFRGLEIRHPHHVSVTIGYDNQLAHLIYAASDLFLMPSKFEPCGLSQMIAMRYGSIPIVRETGGLVDTVTPFNEYEMTGNGFSFTHFNAHDMMYVIRYALRLHQLPHIWDCIVDHAMAADFSWVRSAKEYRQAYRGLFKKRLEE
jgi:starch synthase